MPQFHVSHELGLALEAQVTETAVFGPHLESKQHIQERANTVYIRKPDRPAFERSPLGHFLGPTFEW